MDNPVLSPDTVRTTCPYCGVGCGVLATPGNDGTVAIAGDPDHPANFGRLCSKGSALGETVHLDGEIVGAIASTLACRHPRAESPSDSTPVDARTTLKR